MRASVFYFKIAGKGFPVFIVAVLLSFGSLVSLSSTQTKTKPNHDHCILIIRPFLYTCRRGRIQKISAADPLLNLLQARNCDTKEGNHSLEIKIGCLVEKILHEDGKAVALQTSEGDLNLGNAKLVLGMGVLPPTTLMLNSFPPSSFRQLANIGTRYTGHFMSSLVARVPLHAHIDPRNMYHDLRKQISERVEVAAIHIPAVHPDSTKQFHVQLSAILDKTPVEDTENTMLHFPDVIPAPSMEQLSSSKDPQHIIFVCKTIGEVDHDNKDNWLRLNNEITVSNGVIPCNKTDITCNTTLQVLLSDEDHRLWDTMDESTFAVLERLDSRDDLNDPYQLEYWHESTKSWRKERPSSHQIRRPGLVHDSSTMWMGDDKSSPVGLDYRFKGIENIYLMGAALWPTAGSWNPTCTVTALAIHLADKLLDDNNNNSNNNNNNINNNI